MTTLERKLRDTTRFGRLVRRVSCDSTQALSVADGRQECTVFWADHQTAGRGRQGRSWHDAAAQDLTVTLRVTDLTLTHPTRLAAAIPVAVAATLLPLVPDVAIKWPNDLLLAGRKLCGILIDSHGPRPETHHIGIGINVNRTEFPEELVAQSTSLALATGRENDREELLLELARRVDWAIGLLEQREDEMLATTFRERLGLLDRRVRVGAGNEVVEGRLVRLDLDELELEGGVTLALAHVQSLLEC